MAIECSVHAARWVQHGLALLIALLSIGARADQADIRIDLRANRVSIEAHGATRVEVIRALAKRVNAVVKVHGEASGEVRDWSVRAATVADAVRLLARPTDVMLLLNEDQQVRRIYLIDSAPARPATGRAGSPVARAGTRRDAPASAGHWQMPPATDADALDRRNNMASLGIDASPEALPVLSAALSDPDRGVRLEALRALGQIDSGEAIRLVAQVAMGGEPAERGAAIEVLGASTHPSAALFLSQIRGAGAP